MARAVRNLKMDYAERDTSGNPMMDKTGNPVLSEHNEQVADKLVDILQNSTDAGDRSGSYLTAVRGYNIARQGFEFPEAQSQQPQGFVQQPQQGHGLDFWTPPASTQTRWENAPSEVKPAQDEGEEDGSRGPMPQPNKGERL